MTASSTPLLPGSHVCAVSRSFEEQTEVIVPFIGEGLSNGEYCLFFVSERGQDAWRRALESRGIVPGAQPEGGWLEIDRTTTKSSWANLNSIARAREKWPLMEGALSTHGSMRVIVDEDRFLENGTALDLLCHWEATLNPFLAGTEVREICAYRLDTLPEAAMVAGIRTHPIVVLDGKWRMNPFYEADQILEKEPYLNLPAPNGPRIEEMLARVAEQPEQRLAR